MERLRRLLALRVRVRLVRVVDGGVGADVVLVLVVVRRLLAAELLSPLVNG